jgi:DNA modification methylase
MWVQLKRIIKPNRAIVLFSSQPFTSVLVMSNREMYKYEWIWEKPNGTNFISTQYQPFRVHENILVFGIGATTFTKSGGNLIYNPQKTAGEPYTATTGKAERAGVHRPGSDMSGFTTTNTGDRMPRTIQKFNSEKGWHPTQKPVALLEYLIKTYTNESETVLDFTMGSFTTAIACLNTKRNFIGIEKDDHYFKVGMDRLKKHLLTLDYTLKMVYNQI